MVCSLVFLTAQIELFGLDLIFSARLSSTPEAAVRTLSALSHDKHQTSGSLCLMFVTQLSTVYYFFYFYINCNLFIYHMSSVICRLEPSVLCCQFCCNFELLGYQCSKSINFKVLEIFSCYCDNNNHRFMAIIHVNLCQWHLQLSTGGFCWCKVLLPACSC